MLARRNGSWRALDGAGRQAWKVWSAVADQVYPLVPESRDSPMVLKLEAARWSMDVHGVPIERQLDVWKLVKMLHDVRWHRERTISLFCQHALGDEVPDTEPWDPACRRCRMSLGVDDDASR